MSFEKVRKPPRAISCLLVVAMQHFAICCNVVDCWCLCENTLDQLHSLLPKSWTEHTSGSISAALGKKSVGDRVWICGGVAWFLNSGNVAGLTRPGSSFVEGVEVDQELRRCDLSCARRDVGLDMMFAICKLLSIV